LNNYEAGNGGSAVYGVNKFSDLTPQEFEERYLNGIKRSDAARDNYHHSPSVRGLETLPEKFDWREKNVIGQIWNQEKCGSCWAFATVETIGSRYAIQTGRLVELSTQQLISCETGGELEGCHGGQLEPAFRRIRDEGMIIVNESTYPFNSGDGKTHSCKSPLPREGVKLLNFTYVDGYRPALNETDMLIWLVKYSPLTVSANARAWQDYDGGIIQHHCDDSTVDHAVQVVGYDLTGSVPYWIVRNTWGSDWGEKGYVRLKFGGNMCGMNDEVVYVEDVLGVGL
jgi:cathepsin O